MKLSTKFFIIAMIINLILSFITVWNSMRELRLVDIVTMYATAFGAGVSFAGAVVSLRRKIKSIEPSEKTDTKNSHQE